MSTSFFLTYSLYFWYSSKEIYFTLFTDLSIFGEDTKKHWGDQMQTDDKLKGLDNIFKCL